MQRTVAIVGLGALGSLWAGLFARAGHLIYALDTRRSSADMVTRALVDSGDPYRFGLRRYADPAEAPRPDLVLVAVKAYDTEAAAQAAAALPGVSPVLAIQNGFGNAERCREHLPAERILIGLSTYGAYLSGDGVCTLAGRGEIVLGSPFSPSPGIAAAVGVLSSAGIRTRLSENLERDIWLKALMNAAINPVTALMRIPNGEVVKQPVARALAHAVLEEGAAVARAKGVPLGSAEELAQRLEHVCQVTTENRSSMLRDVTQGHRTEIEEITGALCQYAREAQVPVPVNQALRDLILALGERKAP